MRYQFDWDPLKEQANTRRHRISFRQAATAFRDPNQLSTYDEEHSEDNDRWITIGLDETGTLRVVIHTFEQVKEDLCRIRMISRAKQQAQKESSIEKRIHEIRIRLFKG